MFSKSIYRSHLYKDNPSKGEEKEPLPVQFNRRELDDLIDILAEKMGEMDDDGRDGASAYLEPVLIKLQSAR